METVTETPEAKAIRWAKVLVDSGADLEELIAGAEEDEARMLSKARSFARGFNRPSQLACLETYKELGLITEALKAYR